MKPQPSREAQSSGAVGPRLRFGEFEADLRARELFRNGERIPLQDRPFEVLAALLERPGELILRRELQDRLWPGQIVEFDNNLNTALTKLRRALDDPTDHPVVVETLPKRGYRLLLPVEAIQEPDPPSRSADRTGAASGGRLGWALALTLVAAASLVVAWALRDRAAPAPDARSGTAGIDAPPRASLLVVLPFAALDSGAGDEWLADALTEELITRLAELLPPELGVIARTSAMTFKGAAVDVVAVREALGVSYVLEGSVARDESGLRISARFVHAADRAHLWAASYEAPIDELPRIQRSIAERIATAVAGQLRSRAALAVDRSVPSAAWEAYLQGRFLLTANPAPSAAEIGEAVAQLSRAVEAAPEFALAWAALADAIYRQPGAATEKYARSREAAERALALDPGLAAPHHRLATLALYRDWDWQAADREFALAIALAPHHAVNHHSRAAWYSTQGRHQEALESIERALALDPLSVVLHADAGWYLFVARRYEEAVARCRQALELMPDHRGASSYLFHSLMALGRTAEAAEAARALLEIEEAGPELRRRAAATPEAAIEELRRYRLSVLETDTAEGTVSPGRLALAHLALGDEERAVALLEEGLELRSGWIYPFLAVYPLLDPLADEPRFRRLVAAVGIPGRGV